MIRETVSRNARKHGGNTVFCIVLLLAVGVGGSRAVSGFPDLANALVPPGLLAAQAEGSPTEMVVVDVDAPSRMPPRVAERVASSHSDTRAELPVEDTLTRFAPPEIGTGNGFSPSP